MFGRKRIKELCPSCDRTLHEGQKLCACGTATHYMDFAERTAWERFGADPRFAFRNRSQEQLTADDLNGRLADFVFLDGAHDLALNQATFER